jgi:glycosyltransferase involved in cell wall biosynthesis
MKVVVDALSIGSLSGQHVVYGFLRPLTEWTRSEHEYVLLTYENESPPQDILGANVRWTPVPERLRPWWKRSAWENFQLPKLLKNEKADLLLTASGAAVPRVRIPQVVLAQNPWCFIRAAQKGRTESIKAMLQRRAYRHALSQASMIIYLSNYLRGLYEQLAPNGKLPKAEIAYPGLNANTLAAAGDGANGRGRNPNEIVCVSAMAQWKGAETVVDALAVLRRRGLPATLRLVGPWPDAEYEAKVRSRIEANKLGDVVEVTGQVAKEDLHRAYSQARVYCLMSSCESFGIPAAEAMAFGTPVVAGLDSAVSEVCAGAGLFGPATDAEWTADALARILTSEETWGMYSRQALENASRLRWENSAKAFLPMFSLA